MDRSAITKMAKRSACRDLQIIEVYPTNDYSPFVEEIMTGTPVPSGTTLNTQPGAILHADIAEMNASSGSGAKFSLRLSTKRVGASAFSI